MNGLRIVAAAALVGISALAQPVRAADRLGHQGDEHGTARRRMSGRRLLCQEPPAPTGQFLRLVQGRRGPVDGCGPDGQIAYYVNAPSRAVEHYESANYTATGCASQRVRRPCQYPGSPHQGLTGSPLRTKAGLRSVGD